MKTIAGNFFLQAITLTAANLIQSVKILTEELFMAPRRKAIRAGILFIAILIISGVVLMYRGNDAVFLATEKKDGILTAEQIKLSFDSVGGRLINENVREGQEVHAGQVEIGRASCRERV